METALIIRNMDDAERAARAMSASGFFSDTRQASQAIVKILAGQELGFGPFASMTGVNIIQNKPVLAANLMAAAVKRTGKYNYRVTKHTERECEITFFEGGQVSGTSSFSWDDAEKAGLTGKDNWKKYPRNMLFARALSNGQKWYAPDVFNGALVYTPDELGANVDEEGNAIVETKIHPEVTESTNTEGEESVRVFTNPVDWLMQTHDVTVRKHAENMASLLELNDPKLTQADWERRVNNYTALRDDGNEPKTAAALTLKAEKRS